MPFISEVSNIFIQRFYTGWITLRNQLATPIRVMGRRVIELYDALISGNDWEITPKLSLKRRAGHTGYVTLNFPALNMLSWKTNTMGTIPIIDTTGDIEYVNTSNVTVPITTKTVTTQCGMMGVGNYLYMGNTGPNLKWDGPAGQQGVTNWGIAIGATAGSVGPNTAGTGAQTGGAGVNWVNPGGVTGSASYASVFLHSSEYSQYLQASNFGFAIPVGDTILGIQVSFTAYASVTAPLLVGLMPVPGQTLKTCYLTSTPTTITLGSANDLWGNSWTPAQVNAAGFGAEFAAFFPAMDTNYQVKNVKITIFALGGPTVTPTGVGSFSAVNGYTYCTAYGNSKSGEISNASPLSANTGPFTNKAYVGISVVASTDPQVDQIRVYRTTDSGGGNQFFELNNSPFANTTATVQDTTPDNQLQVTSQAEINLGNTPPPAGIINLEWFSGRMWGSVGNILFASTGPETLSGTAPQSNWNPVFQWVIPGPIQRNIRGPNGMLVFTQDECYIVRGTDITNYTVNEFVKDFGVRSYNCIDTDGTNLYVFTSDRQFIQINAAGAQDIGLAIADQLQTIDPNTAYVKCNRYGLDSIVRILSVGVPGS